MQIFIQIQTSREGQYALAIQSISDNPGRRSQTRWLAGRSKPRSAAIYLQEHPARPIQAPEHPSGKL